MQLSKYVKDNSKQIKNLIGDTEETKNSLIHAEERQHVENLKFE
jgi:hypothetical protein